MTHPSFFSQAVVCRAPRRHFPLVKPAAGPRLRPVLSESKRFRLPSLSGGVRMTYPAALVLIAQADLPVEQNPPVSAAPGLSREPNHCSVPLTPPTSPQQPCSGDRRTAESTPPPPSSSTPSRAFADLHLTFLIFFQQTAAS